jgi:hypothetical protein
VVWYGYGNLGGRKRILMHMEMDMERTDLCGWLVGDMDGWVIWDG